MKPSKGPGPKPTRPKGKPAPGGKPSFSKGGKPGGGGGNPEKKFSKPHGSGGGAKGGKPPQQHDLGVRPTLSK